MSVLTLWLKETVPPPVGRSVLSYQPLTALLNTMLQFCDSCVCEMCTCLVDLLAVIPCEFFLRVLCVWSDWSSIEMLLKYTCMYPTLFVSFQHLALEVCYGRWVTVAVCSPGSVLGLMLFLLYTAEPFDVIIECCVRWRHTSPWWSWAALRTGWPTVTCSWMRWKLTSLSGCKWTSSPLKLWPYQTVQFSTAVKDLEALYWTVILPWPITLLYSADPVFSTSDNSVN